jgi:hypothetical protein
MAASSCSSSSGSGSVGLAAYDRARALHDAGFTAKPIGWRHGFLVERWIESRPLTPADAPAFQCALARYLAFRATAFPTDAPGADPAELAEMLRVNVVEGLGERWADRLPATPTRLRAAVIGDHRLHAWEWRVLPDGRIIKTDAVDHALAHDLIGPAAARLGRGRRARRARAQTCGTAGPVLARRLRRLPARAVAPRGGRARRLAERSRPLRPA